MPLNRASQHRPRGCKPIVFQGPSGIQHLRSSHGPIHPGSRHSMATGTRCRPRHLFSRAPAAFTSLAWARPGPEATLIGYNPVLYRLERFHHGRHTAGQLVTPPLPATAVFDPLTPGEDLLQGANDPSYLDLPGMSWPPLEGHYYYAIRSVNLLGVASATDTRTAVRHHDDIAPASPRVRAIGGPLLLLDIDLPARVNLEIAWDAGEDFVSPDATEFRVTASWTPLSASTMTVRSATASGVL